MDGFFHAKMAEEVEQGIVCRGNIIDVTGAYKQKEYTTFAWFVLLGIVSIILMVISNIYYKKDSAIFAFAFAIAAAAITTTFATIAIVTAAFVAIVTAIGADNKSKKMYYVASAVYYIAMTIFFIVVFI